MPPSGWISHHPAVAGSPEERCRPFSRVLVERLVRSTFCPRHPLRPAGTRTPCCTGFVRSITSLPFAGMVASGQPPLFPARSICLFMISGLAAIMLSPLGRKALLHRQCQACSSSWGFEHPVPQRAQCRRSGRAFTAGATLTLARTAGSLSHRFRSAHFSSTFYVENLQDPSL